MHIQIRRAIEEYASTIIERYKLEVPFHKDIDIIINKLGGKLKFIQSEIDSELCLEKSSSGNKFVIKIADRLCDGIRNYYIAYELSNLFLNTNYVETMSNSEKRVRFVSYASKTVRKEAAEELAYNLLMPKEKFEKIVRESISEDNKVDIKHIANQFGVTADDVVYRIKVLGLLQI